MMSNFTDPNPSNDFLLIISDILDESILFGEEFAEQGRNSFFRFFNYI
jgi:hypothetical protein